MSQSSSRGRSYSHVFEKISSCVWKELWCPCDSTIRNQPKFLSTIFTMPIPFVKECLLNPAWIHFLPLRHSNPTLVSDRPTKPIPTCLFQHHQIHRPSIIHHNKRQSNWKRGHQHGWTRQSQNYYNRYYSWHLRSCTWTPRPKQSYMWRKRATSPAPKDHYHTATVQQLPLSSLNSKPCKNNFKLPKAGFTASDTLPRTTRRGTNIRGPARTRSP